MTPSCSLTASLFLFSVLLSVTIPLHASANSSGGFSVELIHTDSPKSPYYNAASTHYDRIIAASRRSISRANYLSRSLSKSGPGFQVTMIPTYYEYLMTVTLGTPAVKRLLAADTGSDTIWTQCMPCKSCFKQNDPLFDTSKSSTYKKVGCQSRVCQDTEYTICNRRDNSCQFHDQYGSREISTRGALSTETLGFVSTAGQEKISIPNLVFGCSTDTAAGNFIANSSGIIGLGGGPLSLITQLSSRIAGKFAYCLVPFSNTLVPSVLTFGNKAEISGKGTVTTPLVSRRPSTYYYVTLEDITVSGNHRGGKIPVKRAGSSAEPGNVIIDSGTSLTLLDPEVVSAVEKQVSAVVKLPRVKPVGEFRLCFDATKQKSDFDLPDITFNYTGGAVKLSPNNTFLSTKKGIICLAIVPTSLPISIIGSLAQQNFHVGYDLQARTVTFAPANCAN